MRTTLRTVLLAFCTASAAGSHAPLFAQTRPEAVIRSDTQWVGDVLIEHDVTLTGVEVRVEPGSTIRFAADAGNGKPPMLRLESPLFQSGQRSQPARLVLAGTADRPITVESIDPNRPGAIVASANSAAGLQAQHCMFRSLGATGGQRVAQPCILLRLAAPESDLWLMHCRFEQCGPVEAEFFGPGASAEIAGCRFSQTCGATALSLAGTGRGVKVVTSNIADAGIEASVPQVLLRDNVLIGEFVCIAVRTPRADGVRIEGNYVHCTTAHDTGRYALHCETPSATVIDNVLRGGTYVIETAPQTVTGNVLIGAARLQASFNIQGLRSDLPDMPTTTHALLSGMPPRALIADNLFLGPAYAAISTTGQTHEPRIEHNLFDGWGVARRAVHLNLLGKAATGATITDNVFMRYPQPPIYDEAHMPGAIAAARGNLFAAVPEPAYEQVAGIDGLAPGDRQFDTIAPLDLGGESAGTFPATQPVLDSDELMQSGRLTVAELRRRWLDVYRPRPRSPLQNGAAGPRSLTQDKNALSQETR